MGAAYLITDDEGLLVLGDYDGGRIVTTETILGLTQRQANLRTVSVTV